MYKFSIAKLQTNSWLIWNTVSSETEKTDNEIYFLLKKECIINLSVILPFFSQRCDDNWRKCWLSYSPAVFQEIFLHSNSSCFFIFCLSCVLFLNWKVKAAWSNKYGRLYTTAFRWQFFNAYILILSKIQCLSDIWTKIILLPHIDCQTWAGKWQT